MTPSDILKIIGTTAFARYGAMFFSSVAFEITSESSEETFLYFPAQVVSILALIVSGYWAALGIAIGSFVWNAGHLALDLSTSLKLFTSQITGALLALWIYIMYYKPILKTTWQKPEVQDLLLFSLLYSTIPLLTYQVVSFITPEIHPLSLENFILTDLGSLLGSISTFMLLNLGMSGYLTLRKLFLYK